MAARKKPKTTHEYRIDPAATGLERAEGGVQLELLTVKAVEDLGPVGRGQSHARTLRTANKAEFVCKSPAMGYMLVAEYVCTCLARQIGLPVPSPAIIIWKGEKWLGSSNIQRKDHLLPGKPLDAIVNRHEAGPLMVFDIFTHNNDRRGDNVLLELLDAEDASQVSYRLWGIDLGNTLFRDGQYFRSIDGPVHPIIHKQSPLWQLVDDRSALDHTVNQIEAMLVDLIRRLVEETPVDWWPEGKTSAAVNMVVEFFMKRQGEVRDEVAAVFPALYAGA